MQIKYDRKVNNWVTVFKKVVSTARNQQQAVYRETTVVHARRLSALHVLQKKCYINTFTFISLLQQRPYDIMCNKYSVNHIIALTINKCPTNGPAFPENLQKFYICINKTTSDSILNTYIFQELGGTQAPGMESQGRRWQFLLL